MPDIDPKTPQRTPTPEGQSRGVFRTLMFWREMEQASIITFAAALGAAVVILTLLTGWVADWGVHVKAKKKPQPVAAEPAAEPSGEPTRRRAIDARFRGGFLAIHNLDGQQQLCVCLQDVFKAAHHLATFSGRAVLREPSRDEVRARARHRRALLHA